MLSPFLFVLPAMCARLSCTRWIHPAAVRPLLCRRPLEGGRCSRTHLEILGQAPAGHERLPAVHPDPAAAVEILVDRFQMGGGKHRGRIRDGRGSRPCACLVRRGRQQHAVLHHQHELSLPRTGRRTLLVSCHGIGRVHTIKFGRQERTIFDHENQIFVSFLGCDVRGYRAVVRMFRIFRVTTVLCLWRTIETIVVQNTCCRFARSISYWRFLVQSCRFARIISNGRYLVQGYRFARHRSFGRKKREGGSVAGWRGPCTLDRCERVRIFGVLRALGRRRLHALRNGIGRRLQDVLEALEILARIPGTFIRTGAFVNEGGRRQFEGIFFRR
mmetsp:Transcript_50484/g.98749  ORF Transcript_50484/g.98749 Transcript_50484/m.98749 type:complete len:330 (-) Transcript_50484:312-1301(-)